jgi:hypothetical protein
MPEYTAGLCAVEGTELVPFETYNITAVNDEEAVQLALKWRASTISNIPLPLGRRVWLQVLHNGKAVFSKEIGQI